MAGPKRPPTDLRPAADGPREERKREDADEELRDGVRVRVVHEPRARPPARTTHRFRSTSSCAPEAIVRAWPTGTLHAPSPPRSRARKSRLRTDSPPSMCAKRLFAWLSPDRAAAAHSPPTSTKPRRSSSSTRDPALLRDAPLRRLSDRPHPARARGRRCTARADRGLLAPAGAEDAGRRLRGRRRVGLGSFDPPREQHRRRDPSPRRRARPHARAVPAAGGCRGRRTPGAGAPGRADRSRTPERDGHRQQPEHRARDEEQEHRDQRCRHPVDRVGERREVAATVLRHRTRANPCAAVRPSIPQREQDPTRARELSASARATGGRTTITAPKRNGIARKSNVLASFARLSFSAIQRSRSIVSQCAGSVVNAATWKPAPSTSVAAAARR